VIGPLPTGCETRLFFTLLLLFFGHFIFYTIVIPLEYIRLIRVMSFCDLAEYMRHQIGSPPFRRSSVPIVGKPRIISPTSSPVRPVWVVPHEETMRTVKLVVIGSSGVGKTSLRSQVCPLNVVIDVSWEFSKFSALHLL